MGPKAKLVCSRLWGVSGVALAAAMLIWTFRTTELERVGELLAPIGVAGVLILVPQLAALLLESLGWKLVFASMGRCVPTLGLLRVRVAAEAMAQTLPCGVVLSESVKPLLLKRLCHLPFEACLAGMAARKWLLVGSQSVYVITFAICGFGALAGISTAVVGGASLPYLVLGAAVLLLSIAAGGWLLMQSGQVATAVYELCLRIPISKLRVSLAGSRARFAQMDEELRAFFRLAFSSPLPMLAFLGGWLLETLETALILALLGVSLPLSSVGSMEVALSFVRSVVFVVPAGLGVQDVGYVTFIQALGVPDALHVAAAFLILKRAKEVVWAAFGYCVLAIELRAPRLVQPAGTLRPDAGAVKEQKALLPNSFRAATGL
jgi:hypothetical protein